MTNIDDPMIKALFEFLEVTGLSEDYAVKYGNKRYLPEKKLLLFAASVKGMGISYFQRISATFDDKTESMILDKRFISRMDTPHYDVNNRSSIRDENFCQGILKIVKTNYTTLSIYGVNINNRRCSIGEESPDTSAVILQLGDESLKNVRIFNKNFEIETAKLYVPIEYNITDGADAIEDKPYVKQFCKKFI